MTSHIKSVPYAREVQHTQATNKAYFFPPHLQLINSSWVHPNIFLCGKTNKQEFVPKTEGKKETTSRLIQLNEPQIPVKKRPINKKVKNDSHADAKKKKNNKTNTYSEGFFFETRMFGDKAHAKTWTM